MQKLPISVFIITKNEEERLPKAISSVIEWVDEVLVIDSGSTDKTIELAESLGAKTTFNEWQGFGQQKNFGENLCKNDWILNIDADEEISDALREEVFKLVESGNIENYSAFKMHWKMLFFTQKTPPKFGVGSSFIRLYNKTKASFNQSAVHDSVIVEKQYEGQIGELKNIVYHRCFKSMKHWADKINYYTTLQAQDFYDKNRRVGCFRIIIEPFFAFLKAYFIRRYFLYGVDGFLGSLMYAYSKTLRLAKVREIYKINETKN